MIPLLSASTPSSLNHGWWFPTTSNMNHHGLCNWELSAPNPLKCKHQSI